MIVQTQMWYVGIPDTITGNPAIGPIVLTSIVGPMISLTVAIVPVVEAYACLVSLDPVGNNIIEIDVIIVRI